MAWMGNKVIHMHSQDLPIHHDYAGFWAMVKAGYYKGRMVQIIDSMDGYPVNKHEARAMHNGAVKVFVDPSRITENIRMLERIRYSLAGVSRNAPVSNHQEVMFIKDLAILPYQSEVING
jgi:hypothetical protein